MCPPDKNDGKGEKRPVMFPQSEKTAELIESLRNMLSASMSPRKSKGDADLIRADERFKMVQELDKLLRTKSTIDRSLEWMAGYTAGLKDAIKVTKNF